MHTVCIQFKHNPLEGTNRCAHMFETKWYVSHTDNAQAAAVEAEHLNRLSGFLCQRRTFNVGRWMMEKKGMGWRV